MQQPPRRRAAIVVAAAVLVLGLALVQCAGPALLGPKATDTAAGIADASAPPSESFADPMTGEPGTDAPTAAAATEGAATTGPGATSGETPSRTATVTATPTAGRTAVPQATRTPVRTPTPAPIATPTRAPTPRPTAGPTPPPLGSCPMFPSTNVWNKPVSGLPVAASSATMINAIGAGTSLHPDFSATGYGIPYNVVGASTAHVSVRFGYADESDPGPYPIPASPKMEGGSDRHILIVDSASCYLYELFAASMGSSGWTAGSGAIWNLRSNTLRPAGWTSADAAGLPILPGLVRYDEVRRGSINHALRFTVRSTCAGYIYPARHQAGSGSCSSRPPMGLRVRLKASVNISGYGTQARVILQALKTYGMIVADNGSSWYVTGAPDTRWNDDMLHALGNVHGRDFEVVDTSRLRNG